jgi:hypothetical protein
MIIGVTTSIRSNQRVVDRSEEIEGILFLGKLDISNSRFDVYKRITLPKNSFSPSRNSLRGVEIFNGYLALSDCTSVYLIDPKTFEIVNQYTSKITGEIHTLKTIQNILYVSCTNSDHIIGLDSSFNLVYQWDAKNIPDLIKMTNQNVRPMDVDYRNVRKYDTFHINDVYTNSENDLIVNISLYHRLFNITKNKIISLSDKIPYLTKIFNNGRPYIHDGYHLEDKFYINDTKHGKFEAYDGDYSKLWDVSVILQNKTEPHLSRGWLRGMEYLGDHLFILGQNNLVLQIVDVDKKQVVRDNIQVFENNQPVTSEYNISVFCVKKFPSDFFHLNDMIN